MLLGSLNDQQDNKTTPGTPVVSPPILSSTASSPKPRNSEFPNSRSSPDLGGSLSPTQSVQFSQDNETNSYDRAAHSPHNSAKMVPNYTSLSHGRHKSTDTVSSHHGTPIGSPVGVSTRHAETPPTISPGENLRGPSAQPDKRPDQKGDGSPTPQRRSSSSLVPSDTF